MRTITVKQYASETGVPLATVYDRIKKGNLPKGVSAVKIGSTYLMSVVPKKEDDNILMKKHA